MAATILAAAAVAPRAVAEPALLDLSPQYREENLVVSVRLADGLSAETLEEIDSGIETTFEYRIQISRKRTGWPDDVLIRRDVECLVRRDSLTRQYTLTRRVDGELMERRVGADADAMRAFLTLLQEMPVARRSEIPGAVDLEVRVRCDLGLVWRFYLIPWRMTTGWAKAPLPVAQDPEPREGQSGRRR
jgi:uncharacterized protein DUF4390